MKNGYADDFYEIIPTLRSNSQLKDRVRTLIQNNLIVGKSTEEPERDQILRRILTELIDGMILDLPQAYREVSLRMPERESKHRGNSRVYPQGWEERLIRIQLSRFYNQAVLELLMEQGSVECFVPHSHNEQADSKCTQILAGRKHATKRLHDLLISTYEKGNYSEGVKIPEHPHCTHVVRPTV